MATLYWRQEHKDVWRLRGGRLAKWVAVEVAAGPEGFALNINGQQLGTFDTLSEAKRAADSHASEHGWISD